MNRDVQNRIDSALNGSLTDAEMEAFFQDALNDPEILKTYTRQVKLEGDLISLGEDLPMILSAGRMMKSRRFESLIPLIAVPVAAAIVGVIATLAAISLFIDQSDAVATLIEADGCQWSGSDLPTAEGSRLPAGTLALNAGMATLKFDSGATISIEAPATLEVISGMRCRLLEGSLVADVPESAHGFTVDARELEVIDLGTRFGLTTNPLGKSHVMVFDGEVEVKKAGQATAKLLTTGNSMVDGSEHIPTRDEVSRTTDYPLPNYDGYREIEAFKDTFVRYGEKFKNQGSNPLIMVKETDLSETNRRRAVLSFDLANESEFSEAELFLEVESSGLGFSTLIPDSKFAIYGITDDSLDHWSENEVVWDTLPAATDDALLPDKTRKLGEFEIRRGASAATFVTFRTPELTRYLREDANRIATFLIVRLTGEYESQGLVHAFAAREHPTSKAPTLYLRPQ